jgi:site-specific recombinase XerD
MIDSIDTYISERQSESNKKNCERSLYRFYIYLNDHDLQLKDLTQAKLQDYAKYLVEDQNLASATASNEFNHLRGWLKSIDRGDLLDGFNYNKHLERTTHKDAGNESDQYLTEDEYRILLDNINTKYPNRDYIIIRSFVELGCRPSELREITIEGDLDLEDRSVWIDGKKGSNSRRVYFSETFKAKLKGWLGEHRNKFKIASSSPYLLTSERSPQISQQAINKTIKKVAESAGLQSSYATTADGRNLNSVTATTLRHSYATLRLQEGAGSEQMDVKTVSKLMGHTEVEDSSTSAYINPRKDLKEADDECRPKLIPVEKKVAENI